MYKVTIERINSEKYTQKENMVVKSTPTEILDDDYNNRKKVNYITEHQVVDVEKVREVRRTVLNQEIEDEASFNLAKVIQAINNL